MKDPRNWSWLVAVLAIVVGVGLTTISCGDDDDDDEDEDEVSYGTDIHGIYSVVINTALNTCEPDSVGDEEQWVLRIEQTEDFGWATVYRQLLGTGTEEEEYFKARVYGTSVLLLSATETIIGESDCLQVKTRNYRLTVSEDGSGITGRLYEEVFYLGAACDASTQDCQFEWLVSPTEPADDDAPDDDTIG